MAMTEFTTSSNSTVKRWATDLAVEAEVRSYFRKFMGTGNDMPIKVLKDLNKAAGDRIRYSLRMKLDGYGVTGDNILEGTSGEKSLTFYTDDLLIDQLRVGVKNKGKMSEQRVLYNLRKEGRNSLATWWAETLDAMCFIYLSGARGMDSTLTIPLGWTGHASNSLETPDSSHVVYGGNATGLSDIDSGDAMDVELIEQLVSVAETTDPMIQPLMYEGERRYVLLLHPWQAYKLRTSISQNDWLEIHKAVDGPNSPIFKNALGEYAGVVLHKHRNTVRFDSTTGCSSGVTAARGLFLGAQAGAVAYANGGGPGRFTWHEEMDDRGNALAISTACIFGITKTRFNSADFGVIALDTYAADPTS